MPEPLLRSRHAVRAAHTGALVGLLVLATACSDRAPEPPPRPHVLLVSLDTLRADRLPPYGHERPTAPHIAELARRGAVFERCIATANWTLPTHASLFTGLNPAVHGVEGPTDALDPARATLGEAFAAAGYRTAGYFSNPFVGPRFGFTRGFDVFDMARPDDPEARRERAGTPRGSVTRVRPREPGPRDEDYFVDRTSEAVTADALAFLETVDPDAGDPFLLFLHYNDVHADYIAPQPFDRLFTGEYDGPVTGEGYTRDPAVHADMDPDDLEHVRALYDQEIAWVDSQLGRVLERMEAMGLADETLVVVTADHGEGFFEHGGKEHHYGLWRELVEVPWIVTGPGVRAGLRVGHPVSQADIAPTLLELAGLDGLPDADGISWAPLLTGEGTPPRPRPAVSRTVLKPLQDEPGDELWSVRTGAMTVVRRERPDGSVRHLVYDRRSDPWETSPLPEDDPRHADAVALLEGLRAATLARRDGLGWTEGHADLPEDPELLEQMRQWGYIR